MRHVASARITHDTVTYEWVASVDKLGSLRTYRTEAGDYAVDDISDGTWNSTGARFCQSCGEGMDVGPGPAARAQTNTAGQSDDSDRDLFDVFIGGVAGLVALFFAIVVITSVMDAAAGGGSAAIADATIALLFFGIAGAVAERFLDLY